MRQPLFPKKVDLAVSEIRSFPVFSHWF